MLTDFQIRLLRNAQYCALVHGGGECFWANWLDMLSNILHHWSVAVKMDKNHAIGYMIEVSGVWHEPSNNCDFWFLNSLDYQELCANGPQWNRVYYVTIAVFETLNYWCWHSAPLSITLNADILAKILKKGKIHIDFSAYDEYRKYHLFNLNHLKNGYFFCPPYKKTNE